MSRTNLKKELAVLTKEELIDVLLVAYKANKEIKEYFEYYIDPQPKSLFEKYEELIKKEINRVKYGHRSKARISVIKKYLKKFRSFEPGYDYVIDLYLNTIENLLIKERTVDYLPRMFDSIGKLIKETLDMADVNNEFDKIFTRLDDMGKKSYLTSYSSRLVKSELQKFLDKNVGEGQHK